MIRTRRMDRRRGQGMTEYIVIVGLIAIGLVVAVGNFRTQIDITIQGTDGNGGMAGKTNGIADTMNPGAVGGGNPFKVRSGRTVTSGKYNDTGATWDPSTDPR